MSDVLIDNREGSNRLVKLPEIAELKPTLTTLESGDIFFAGNGPNGDITIGVEVKSITDLLSSFANGRLLISQAPRMLEYYDLNWLVYYGVYRRAPRSNDIQIYKPNRRVQWQTWKVGNRNLPIGFLESRLIDLQTIGLRVKHVNSEEEVGRWFGTLYRSWTKEFLNRKGLQGFDKSQDFAKPVGVNEVLYNRACFIAQFPGVGFKRAMSAAKYFESIQSAVNAGVGEWEMIDGIGKVLAKSIVKHVRRKGV